MKIIKCIYIYILLLIIVAIILYGNSNNTVADNKKVVSRVETFTETFYDENIVPHIDEVTGVKYITYEDIGIAEEGEDSFYIIKQTHEIANKYGYEVRATLSEYNIYRLNDTSVIKIQTSTNWNNATFIIHDEEVVNYNSRNYSIFEIKSYKDNIVITDRNILDNITINKKTGYIEQLKGNGNCLCLVYNSNKKQFIRSGSNKNEGYVQTDLFKIDNYGNVLNEIQWDFDEITSIKLIPIPDEQIIVQNGNFITNLDKNQYEQTSGYWQRNIKCTRSNTIIKNINHTLDNEEHVGGPYFGFIKVSYVSELQILDCKLVAHKYKVASNYDLILEYSVNTLLENICCDNITDANRWGIVGANYIKDFTYKNCTLNKVDAHCGVHNLNIENCKIGFKGISLVGSGLLKITNTERISGKSFLELRSDYGSTWDGNIEIIDCKFNNTSDSNQIVYYNVAYENDGTLHYYGYDKVLPNIYIKNLEIENTKNPNKEMYVFYNSKTFNGNSEGSFINAGYSLPKEIIIDNPVSSMKQVIKPFYQKNDEQSSINTEYILNGKLKITSVDYSYSTDEGNVEYTKKYLSGIEEETANEFFIKEGFSDIFISKAFKNNIEITDDYIGTNTVIRLYNDLDLFDEYILVLYGDINGDGMVNSLDALFIIENKLGNRPIENETFIEAGRVSNITRDTKKVPNALDALAVIKHKLGEEYIEQ